MPQDVTTSSRTITTGKQAQRDRQRATTMKNIQPDIILRRTPPKTQTRAPAPVCHVYHRGLPPLTSHDRHISYVALSYTTIQYTLYYEPTAP